MRAPGLLLALLLCGAGRLAAALFEDQAGTYDWYKAHVGLIRAAAFHPSKPRVCTATQQSVLGCLSLRDGAIAWRKQLEDGQDAAFLQVEEHGLIVVATHKLVQAFDHEGFLKWEKRLGPCSKAAGGHAAPKLAKMPPEVAGGAKVAAVAVQHGDSVTVRRWGEGGGAAAAGGSQERSRHDMAIDAQ